MNFKIENISRWILYLSLLLLFNQCQQIVLVIDEIPENTPKGDLMYVTGNFNYWDPADPRFTLRKSKSGQWFVNLPKGSGTIEYKFTRGDWSTVEKDLCGKEMDSRSMFINNSDTVHHVIDSWNDTEPLKCRWITIALKGLPKETEDEDTINIVGTFNNWEGTDSQFDAEKN